MNFRVSEITQTSSLETDHSGPGSNRGKRNKKARQRRRERDEDDDDYDDDEPRKKKKKWYNPTRWVRTLFFPAGRC